MKQLLRQPLLHFLLIGGMLFLVFELISLKSAIAPDAKTIVINHEALLDFMQYRSQAFNRQYFSQQFDTMSPPDRQRLIDDLVREEVLYREALALRLNDNDYVIKRRLVQKLEFLTQGFISAGGGLTEAEIKVYYNDHKNEYYAQPFVTFTHVFFDYERHNREQVRLLAENTLRELNGKQVAFADSLQYGDRFLYHANYVERTPDFVASHFGVATAEAIFALTPDDKHWYGPYESSYGLHLILLIKKESGRFPELAEIIERVRDDAEQARVREKTEAAINDIVKTYAVKIIPD
ncbi:MAG: PPIC-type PPIASE domain protein [Gammaproteobacteria bacterium]|nr:PPIC-type PPIASE domain protein [Gammaproteobacteria bacterium]